MQNIQTRNAPRSLHSKKQNLVVSRCCFAEDSQKTYQRCTCRTIILLIKPFVQFVQQLSLLVLLTCVSITRNSFSLMCQFTWGISPCNTSPTNFSASFFMCIHPMILSLLHFQVHIPTCPLCVKNTQFGGCNMFL